MRSNHEAVSAFRLPVANRLRTTTRPGSPERLASALIPHVDCLTIIGRLSAYGGHLAREKSELLPGTLDMLVLQTLSLGSLHGYAIAQHIERLSQEVLQVEQGSLYPALERLQRAGLVKSKWGTSPTGRLSRYYTITASGRKRLGQEISEFDRLLLAIARVLGRAEGG